MSDETVVEITSYDPAWESHFEDEGLTVLEALGESVRAIEHVGETAVPGMVARPVVDILVGVDALEAVSRRVVALQQIGYEYLGEAGVEGRLLFRKRGAVGFDVSVVLYRGERWQRRIRVRDYLREHPEAADPYAERLRQLAEQADSDEAFEARRREMLAEVVPPPQQ